MKNKNTRNLYCQVDTRDICFIKYIFEALEGIAIVSTLDKLKNEIVIRIAPGCEEEVIEVIDGLKSEININVKNASEIL